MMERRVFPSEEVYSCEGSLEEPVDVYDDNGSQMRFQQNVVYVPHVLTPALLVEYVPVYVNYQTYDPYLINRFEVAYVPFLRPVSYIQFVPYYSLPAPEIISSSAQHEEDIFSNRYLSSDSYDAYITEISEFSSSSEDSESQHRESFSNEFFETSVADRERNLEQIAFDNDSSKKGNDCSRNDDDNRTMEADDSYLSWFDVSEAPDVLNLIHDNEASFDDGSDKKNNDSFQNDDEDRGMVAGDSHLSCFDVTEKAHVVNPIDEKQASFDDCSGKKKNDTSHNADEDRGMEAGDSNLTWSDVTKKPYVVNPIDGNHASSHYCNGKKEYDSSRNEDEDRDMQVDNSNLSCSDVPEKCHVVNKIGENQTSHDDPNGKKENNSFHNEDEDRGKNDDNSIDENQTSLDDTNDKKEHASFHNEDKDRGMLVDNLNLSRFDVPEKCHVVNSNDENQTSLDDTNDKKEHDSFHNEDECDGPIITLEDILASEEYWKVKREEYWHKRRSKHLYRSALERDIRPKKSLPDVRTLPTIFEDLPFPVNEPYDDGLDSNIDEFFDLPPLHVKKSESSRSELTPKKKKFRNTRKFFSRLFRCFKPKTVISVKPP